MIPDDDALRVGRTALPRLAHRYAEILFADMKKPVPTGVELESALEHTREVVIGTAYHEASHAVVARHLTGSKPAVITIEQGSDRHSFDTWGFVWYWRDVYPLEVAVRMGLAPNDADALRKGAERIAMGHLAGPVQSWLMEDENERLDISELLYDESEGEREDDRGLAHRVLNPHVPDPRRRRRRIFRLTKRLVPMLQRAPVSWFIEELAEALLDIPTLHGPALDALLCDVPFRRHRQRR